MNVSKVLLKCGSMQNKTPLVLRTINASRLSLRTNNNSLIQKRMLMSSIETGGIAPIRAPYRFQAKHKIIAGAVLAGTLVVSYHISTREEEINKFLGLNLNTSAIALVGEILIGGPLAFILFAAALPL